MKKVLFYIASTIGAVTLLAACSDFDDINKRPTAVSELDTKPYYALNKAIIKDGQNPNDAERVFVLNWAASSRQDGESSSRCLGRYNDEWNTCLYNLSGTCIKACVDAMDLVEKQMEAGVIPHEEAFFPNVYQFARIWRVYLMSEFIDSFGPMPIDGFMGVNPSFVTVKEDYNYMYKELSEAVEGINLEVAPTTEEAACDPAYGYDAAKWKKFAISLWMRLAMRLSEADGATAQAEFEAAVKAGQGITDNQDVFRVPELGGWDDMTAVMSRGWNNQTVSAAFANITTNFGGVKAEDIFADASGALYKSPDPSRYADYIIDASSYLGINFADHWEVNSDNPTQGFFFNGIPSYIDPRALTYFVLPGDYNNRKANGAFPWAWDPTHCTTVEYMYKVDGETTLPILETRTDAKYCWNGLGAGIWAEDKATYNGIVNGGSSNPDATKEDGKVFGYTNGYIGTYPLLADEYRNGSTDAHLPAADYRFYFGPWETYFLLAEAACRGWNAGISAKTAYENGIKASLDYVGMGHHYTAYVQSRNYNRVGTSVDFTHTTEPSNYEITYENGYADPKSAGRIVRGTYKYPDANKILYKGHKLNDELTKIITQKWIANMPFLPLENWCEHRRLGLPFWEIPASAELLPDLPNWSKDSYKTGQTFGCFNQRMKYPSSLNNADPNEYKNAVSLLGGEDITATPIWWAIGGH